MPSGTKERIAAAAKRLILEKKTKKLTVTDLVEECHITRQAFYYYFKDIPDLLRWILAQNTDRLVEETLTQGDPEKGLRYLFLLALQLRPYVAHSVQSNYREEMEQILQEHLFTFFLRLTEKQGLYAQCSSADRELVTRYHSQAILGMIRHWAETGQEDLDHIVHVVHQILVGDLSPR